MKIIKSLVVVIILLCSVVNSQADRAAIPSGNIAWPTVRDTYLNPMTLELYNFLGATAGVLPATPTFSGLIVSGGGDSWLELENNTSFTDSLTGKYGIRFYNGVLQQILNGTATNIGSASIQELASDPAYTDLDTGEMAVSTSSGDLFIKTATGLYTIAGTYAADPTTPTLTSLTIPTSGDTATAVFSEAVSYGAGGAGSWTLNSPTNAMTYASGTGTDTIVFNLASTILSTDTPTVSYTQPTNGFESADDGVDLASITNASVTNNSTQTGGSAKDANSVFYYTADNAGGELVAETYTGTTSGTLTAATITTGYNHTTGGTKALTGAGAADTTSNITFTASDTGFDSSNGFVTCWIYPTAVTDDNQFFGADTDATNYIRAWVETDRTVKLYFYGGVLSALTTSDTVALNTANKVDFRWNTTSNRISVRINDGSWADKTDVDIAAFTSAPAAVSIGNNRSTNGFFGYVDDFELWRKDDQTY